MVSSTFLLFDNIMSFQTLTSDDTMIIIRTGEDRDPQYTVRLSANAQMLFGYSNKNVFIRAHVSGDAIEIQNDGNFLHFACDKTPRWGFFVHAAKDSKRLIYNKYNDGAYQLNNVFGLPSKYIYKRDSALPDDEMAHTAKQVVDTVLGIHLSITIDMLKAIEKAIQEQHDPHYIMKCLHTLDPLNQCKCSMHSLHKLIDQ
jgi:hypothetical protein